MADFQRHFESVDKLQEEILFQSKLKADCEKGDVFPAVRGGYMSFYHAGGSLFKYDRNGFSTHIKYAFVPKDIKGDYITQKKLQSGNLVLEDDFVQGYTKIKERCEKYAGKEASGVSSLYKESPMSKKRKSNRYCLVDIEVAFAAEDDDRTTDRIDIVLYDNEEKQLLFCEAKHFSNGEIRAKTGEPEAVKQLERYNDQIKNNREQILEQYKKHFEVLCGLFDIKLNSPETIHPHCGLLVFGFDEDQRRGRLKKHLPSLGEHKCYTIGIVDDISVQTLYEKLIR